ncbi:MAG TPA: PEP/pyruvate-binding domain-containing protein, partial [Ilumatobacteraceae bacterium]|nr:PEP/pyruvate-binding domain-containing protein [Ilumatobacteraceae bacterium]
EDLAHSSFAGLYRSVLDVDPDDPDAVVDAVLSVFASLWHPQATTYRHALGIVDDDAAMAVVVMRMVPAERAGVVFTVDPADATGRARVEAVDGLAETLVSGERTPDAWVLDPFAEHPHAPPEVSAALREAARIEVLAGSPQDVEWAWADGTLWVVQARPITTAGSVGDGFDSPDTDADLTTAGIGEMLPGVLPPLLWEVNRHLVDEAFLALLDGLGLPVGEGGRTGLLRRVRGRAALDFSALHEMAAQLPGGAAEELEAQYFGSRRAGRPVTPAAPSGGRLAGLRHDLRVFAHQHRATQDAEIVCVAVAEIQQRRPDLGALDDAAVLRYRFRLIDLGVRAMTAELASAATAAAAYRQLELTLASHVDEVEAGRLAGVLTAQRGVVTVPATDASAAVFAGPSWAELDRRPPDRRSPTDGDAEEALRTRFDAAGGFDPDAPLGWFRWRRIERTITGAVEHLRQREKTKAAVLELGGEVRRVHLELAERLVARGALEEPSDVDLLTSAELIGALGNDGPPIGLVARRRRWRRRYEDEGPLPMRFRGPPDRHVPNLPPGDRLEGSAASAGRCTDRAVFMTAPDDALPKGAILVAEATDASWSPTFVHAGAIVLERGGPLSHAAILARELGVPAVLDVGTGARALDGRLITVDGDSGIVVVHEEPSTTTAEPPPVAAEDR